MLMKLVEGQALSYPIHFVARGSSAESYLEYCYESFILVT